MDGFYGLLDCGICVISYVKVMPKVFNYGEMRYLLTFLLFVFSLTHSYAQHGDTPAIKDVSLEEFRQLMDSLKEEVVVDLRTPEELKAGKIPDAVVIDNIKSNHNIS